jgi:rare lipoprotein A
MRSSDAFAFVSIVLLTAPIAAVMGHLQPLGAEETNAEPVAQQRGIASFYSDKYRGQPTANGETFSQNKLTAASRSLPLGTRVTVINDANGKSVDVKINDRGPFVDGRVIDLSRKAAARIGLSEEQGITAVIVEARPSSQPTPELREAIRMKAAARTEIAEGPSRVGD